MTHYKSNNRCNAVSNLSQSTFMGVHNYAPAQHLQESKQDGEVKIIPAIGSLFFDDVNY